MCIERKRPLGFSYIAPKTSIKRRVKRIFFYDCENLKKKNDTPAASNAKKNFSYSLGASSRLEVKIISGRPDQICVTETKKSRVSNIHFSTNIYFYGKIER